MRLLKGFIFGLLASLALDACATFYDRYKYYGLDVPSYEGTLLGKAKEEDLPFSKCQPDEQSKGKCVVMITAEFKRLAEKYVDMEKRLVACESRY